MSAPAKATPRSATLLEHAISRAGVIKGARACEVVATWAIAVQAVGHDLGDDEGGHVTAAVREYAKYWRMSERTAWRHHVRFREVFPEQESPAAFAQLAIEQYERRRAEKQAARLDKSSALGLQLAL